MRRYVLINSGGILALIGVIIVQLQILGGSALPGGYMRSAYRHGLSRGSFGPSYIELLSAAVADAGEIISFYLGGIGGEKVSQVTRNIARNGRMITGKDILRHLDKATNIAGIALNVLALGAAG